MCESSEIFETLVTRGSRPHLEEFPAEIGPIDARGVLFWLDESRHYAGLIDAETRLVRNIAWLSDDMARRLVFDQERLAPNETEWHPSGLRPPLWLLGESGDPTFQGLLRDHGLRLGRSGLVSSAAVNRWSQFLYQELSAPPFRYQFAEKRPTDSSIPISIILFIP
jgi:hypothetical protein